MSLTDYLTSDLPGCLVARDGTLCADDVNVACADVGGQKGRNCGLKVVDEGLHGRRKSIKREWGCERCWEGGWRGYQGEKLALNKQDAQVGTEYAHSPCKTTCMHPYVHSYMHIPHTYTLSHLRTPSNAPTYPYTTHTLSLFLVHTNIRTHAY